MGVCYCGCDCSLFRESLSVLNILPIPLQQCLKAGMVAEGVPGRVQSQASVPAPALLQLSPLPSFRGQPGRCQANCNADLHRVLPPGLRSGVTGPAHLRQHCDWNRPHSPHATGNGGAVWRRSYTRSLLTVSRAPPAGPGPSSHRARRSGPRTCATGSPSCPWSGPLSSR